MLGEFLARNALSNLDELLEVNGAIMERFSRPLAIGPKIVEITLDHHCYRWLTFLSTQWRDLPTRTAADTATEYGAILRFGFSSG